MVKQKEQKVKQKEKKDSTVKARISERVKSDLQDMADDYGMSLSSLVAYVLGQWVHQQKVVLGPMIQEISDTARKTVEKQLELDDMLRGNR